MGFDLFGYDCDLSKKMFFASGYNEMYKLAIERLVFALECESVSELENLIFTALKNYTESLLNNDDNKVDFNILVKFHDWLRSINNESNISPPDTDEAPRNIVAELRLHFRLKREGNNLTNEESLLLFMLEGENARKIAVSDEENETNEPGVNFIDSQLFLLVTRNVSNLRFSLDSATQHFMGYLNWSREEILLVSEIINFENSLFESNEAYSILIEKECLTFTKQKNEDTGASVFGLQQGIEKGEQIMRLAEFNDLDSISQLQSTLEEYLNTLLLKLDTLENRLTEEVYDLLCYDIAESFSKLYVAYQVVTTSLRLNNCFVNAHENSLTQLYDKCLTGNFPTAGKRNQLLRQSPLSELFLQRGLAAACKKAEEDRLGVSFRAAQERRSAESAGSGSASLDVVFPDAPEDGVTLTK